jgi:putative DNA methylase
MKRKPEASQSHQLALALGVEQANDPKRRFTDKVVAKVIKGKTKKQNVDQAIAHAVKAGKELHLESVDFSDSNRPKTCLEVDFPILPINRVAAIEGNAGKPIYQMSKWWARRRSSVFRAMLIAAATKAPDDPSEAAKLVWDSYYGNHQKNEAFKKLKVADIFMGGGTTIVEGARLGMQMFGNDLNPVAWFVVKNELAQIDPIEVQKLLDHIEDQVKPQIMPFYACDCARGHKGKWTHIPTGKMMPAEFNALSVAQEHWHEYKYEGPEIVYTFWAKHGPCQATGCGHRTPIMSSPVIAIKTLTTKAWKDVECVACKKRFDVEEQDARMAPSALFVVSPDEAPYSIRESDGSYKCPHCDHIGHGALGKSSNKKVALTLLIHPKWLKGTPKKSNDGVVFGGSITDDLDATVKWYTERSQSLALIEFRGQLPEQITCPDSDELFFVDVRGGTVPKQAAFKCMEDTCGSAQEIVVSIERTGKSGPIAAFADQGYCPECAKNNDPYGGRFFAVPSSKSLSASLKLWHQQRFNELRGYWPEVEIPSGYMSPIQNDLPAHGFPRFADLYNHRQLIVHSLLLKSLKTSSNFDFETRMFVLGAFQQYLKNQCMLAFWHKSHDHFAPALSERNFHPKTTSIEVGVFTPVGYGPWPSTYGALVDGLEWKENPWELLPTESLKTIGLNLDDKIKSRSVKVHVHDPVVGKHQLTCNSSSELAFLDDASFDLVITDPPFGGLIHYSELADFFYVWLRLFLCDSNSVNFKADFTPKALEAVANQARNPLDHEQFYQRILTDCWREAGRILKPGGILAFTFHHSEDEPWVAVLESLFEAGFYLEATYPIRSDETKGSGQFGSKQIEFDIVHVCRKRTEETNEISWARLRRKLLLDVKQLQDVLEHHQQAGLAEADLQVIRRGKALEYYSKHYGKVYVEKGREFTVKEALAGINQLLDDQRDTNAEVPPIDAEPYTRQFLRLFADAESLPRDQMQKYLRGTGVSPAEFVERGWCVEKSKIFTVTPPIEQAQKWKGTPRKGLGKDLDQAMFLIGACYEKSGINVNDTLNNQNFIPHPALGEILDWFSRHGGDDAMKGAAQTARSIFRKWVSNNEPKIKQVQQTLFDLDEYDK